MKKKILSFVLSAVMAVTFFYFLPVNNTTLKYEKVLAAEKFTPRLTAPTRDNTYYYESNVFYNAGYGMPNCTCYAFGRAYELMNYVPKLSHGDASAWYNYNISTGSYPYGSTPKLGAVACWSGGGYGHVAIVEKIEGSSVTVSESSFGGKFFAVTTATDMNTIQTGFQGYIYLGEWYDAAKPSYAKVSLEKDSFGIGEEVKFNFSSDTATSYGIGIDDEEGNRIDSYWSGDNYYLKKFDKPGKYSCYVSAYNAAGQCDSERIYFTIGEKPKISVVSIEKEAFTVGEEVEFNFSSDTATSYGIGIDDEKGNRIDTYWSGDSYYLKKFDKPGKYSCYVSAYNEFGICDSKRIYFTINEKTTETTALTVTTTVTTTTIITVKPTLIGDTNGNGIVNAADLVMLQLYLTRKDVLTNAANANMNSDGKIDVFDAVLLRRMLLNK